MKIVEPSVKLLWITENPEQAIELAGRTCYKSEDKITKDSAGKFVAMLTKAGHHAMLEHAYASFHITTDRGITHEIVRHRIASYAQESTRYCNYSKDKFGNECSFIQPPKLDNIQIMTWIASCETAESMYFEMIRNGCAPQIARSVLPNCLKTEIVMTANLREFMHFIKLRGSLAAHPQIRPIAKAMWNILMMYAPNMYKDLNPHILDAPK